MEAWRENTQINESLLDSQVSPSRQPGQWKKQNVPNGTYSVRIYNDAIGSGE